MLIFFVQARLNLANETRREIGPFQTSVYSFIIDWCNYDCFQHCVTFLQHFDFLFWFHSKPCLCFHLFRTGSHSEISFSGLHFPIKSLIERWIQGSDTCSLNKADAAISSSCLLPPACQTPRPTKEWMEQTMWAFGSCFSAKSCGLVKFPGHAPFLLQMAKPWTCLLRPTDIGWNY